MYNTVIFFDTWYSPLTGYQYSHASTWLFETCRESKKAHGWAPKWPNVVLPVALGGRRPPPPLWAGWQHPWLSAVSKRRRVSTPGQPYSAPFGSQVRSFWTRHLLSTWRCRNHQCECTLYSCAILRAAEPVRWGLVPLVSRRRRRR